MSKVVRIDEYTARTRRETPGESLERAIRHLRAARGMREAIDGDGLRREAALAAELVRAHTEKDHQYAIAYAKAIELAVEAELNDDRLQQARQIVRPAVKHIRATAKNTHAEVTLRRVALTVRELSGEAETVIATFASYAAVTELAQEPLERLRYLQRVLTCAKRCPQRLKAMPYVEMALREGMELARSLEGGEYRGHVACFLHVAGYMNVRFEIDPALGAALLTESLESRPDTPRDRATRGMGEAERMLALGDRDAAIERFDQTLAGLARQLPRHHRSGREMLRARGLVAA
jgi:hypothetical protein